MTELLVILVLILPIGHGNSVWVSANINRGPSLPQQNNLTKMSINSVDKAINSVTASSSTTAASSSSTTDLVHSISFPNSNSNSNLNSNSNANSNSGNNNNNNNNKNVNILLMLRPSTPSITHFVNDSFIIFCATKATTDKTRREIDIAWLDPNEMPLLNLKGRVHIEKKTGLLALVFEHISLDDKGNWTCNAHLDEMEERKSFELLVNQKISFHSTEMVQSVREGRDATVYCLVKGDPAPEISWLFNGEYINSNSSKHRKLSDGLFIKNVTQADAGEYMCRAMRITPTFSDSDQITILLRIQHKPQWFDNETAPLQYAFIGGQVNISCDAMGEPPPSFTWLHDGEAITGRNYRLLYADYGSTLQIQVQNNSDFGDYKCKVANPLGMIEKIIKLRKGQKPATPSRFQLRRAFTDGFDFDIRSVKQHSLQEHMQTLGYRVEYMSEGDFKFSAGNWTFAKWRDFLFHRDGRRFIATGLSPNTTYLMRAAARNLAGLSDWSSVKIFATLTNAAATTALSNFFLHLGMSSVLAIVTLSSCFHK